MTPIQHKSNNDILGAPPGMSPEECQSICISRVIWSPPSDSKPPVHGVISFWQPNEKELQLLNSGKSVYISFLGTTHPPVALGVDGDGQLGF